MSINPIALVSQVLAGGKGPAGAKELTTDVLKIRGKTILFKNTIYHIPNISAIEIVTFSKAIPWWAIGGILLGLLFITGGGWWSVLALVVIAFCAFALFRYWQRRTEYGLLLLLNAGIEVSSVLMSRDFEFISRVAVVIYNVMNSEEDKAVNINFDQRQISEVAIHDVNGSTIVTGSVTGNIVNSVQ